MRSDTSAMTWQTDKKKPDLLVGLFYLQVYQNSLRPLFAAIRMRKAFSLMKPAASA